MKVGQDALRGENLPSRCYLLRQNNSGPWEIVQKRGGSERTAQVSVAMATGRASALRPDCLSAGGPYAYRTATVLNTS